MKRRKLALFIGCSLLLTSQLTNLITVRAEESFRVKRPTAAETANDATANGDTSSSPNNNNNNNNNNSSGNGFNNRVLPAEVSIDSQQQHPLQATATMNLETASVPAFRNAVLKWEQQNNPNFQSQTATADSAHHGLKSHLGGAFLAMASVAGGMANSYIPIASVTNGRRSGEPTIIVDAGHCPAMVDPAFQIPVKWWDALAEEQKDPYLGPQWQLWFQAVQETFAARAKELRSTPGAAALHVIINPNGTIFNMSPYTGPERHNSGIPISEPTLMHLRDMVGRMGGFPPFPGGSKVRCYHLIFDGAAGI